MNCLNKMVLLVTMTSFSACNLSQEQTNPSSARRTSQVDLSFDGYSTASILDLILPKAYAAVSDLKFCFKRLRFKRLDEDTLDVENSEDNVDFNLGEVVIDSSGKFLGSIEIPEGTYKRIEFDLESNCGTGVSVDLTNDSGNFTSNERITIKFNGIFTADDAFESLKLSVQPILNSANTYTGTGSLKDNLEGASGTF